MKKLFKCKGCRKQLELEPKSLIEFCPHCGEKLGVTLADLDQLEDKPKTFLQRIGIDHDYEELDPETEKKYYVLLYVLLAVVIVLIFVVFKVWPD